MKQDGKTAEQRSLLEQLLELLKEGGIRSTAELARQLGVSEALVGAMIEALARDGYLVPVGEGCATACEGCALNGMCAAPRVPGAALRMLAMAARQRQTSPAAKLR